MRVCLRYALLWLLPLVAHADQTELIARGEYLAQVGGCIACHTDSERPDQLLAGGAAITTPRGTFYAPNITPHPQHGIGGWTEQDLARALTEGVSPDGRHYYPAFPYTSYSRLWPDDIRALKRYLDTVSPVDRPDRPHQLPWYVTRAAVWGWKKLYFNPGAFKARTDKPADWNRGAYLVQAVGHCAECHSPRNSADAIVEQRRLAGTDAGPDGKPVPNITPDKASGIGGWSAADLAYYLRTGAEPDGDYAGGLMGEVIDRGLHHLIPQDARAIAGYLLSLEPIHHPIR